MSKRPKIHSGPNWYEPGSGDDAIQGPLNDPDPTWLDEQLSTDDWRPMANLNKPFASKGCHAGRSDWAGESNKVEQDKLAP